MKTYNVTVNGVTYSVVVEEVAGGAAAPVAAQEAPLVESVAVPQNAADDLPF